mgnify:CR=1 FL=1
MSDLVMRLRGYVAALDGRSIRALCQEAADEIGRIAGLHSDTLCEVARLTSELAHVARSLAWQQDERRALIRDLSLNAAMLARQTDMARQAETERDEARAELAAIATAAGAYPDSDLPSLVATLNRAATAYDDQHDSVARLTADRDEARVARDPS